MHLDHFNNCNNNDCGFPYNLNKAVDNPPTVIYFYFNIGISLVNDFWITAS